MARQSTSCIARQPAPVGEEGSDGEDMLDVGYRSEGQVSDHMLHPYQSMDDESSSTSTPEHPPGYEPRVASYEGGSSSSHAGPFSSHSHAGSSSSYVGSYSGVHRQQDDDHVGGQSGGFQVIDYSTGDMFETMPASYDQPSSYDRWGEQDFVQASADDLYRRPAQSDPIWDYWGSTTSMRSSTIINNNELVDLGSNLGSNKLKRRSRCKTGKRSKRKKKRRTWGR